MWKLRQYFLFISHGFRIGPVKRWFEFRLDHGFYRGTADIHLVNQLAQMAQERTWRGRVVRAAQRLIAGRLRD